MTNFRTCVFLMLLAAVCLSARAADDLLSNARKLLLRGKYTEAGELYSSLATKNPIATIGLARCLRAQGKDEEAKKVLVGQLVNLPGQIDNLPHNADVLAELAEINFDRGLLEEARKNVDLAIQANRNQVLANWISAELARVTGKLDEADRGYAWLIHYYNDHDTMSSDQLRWIGLAAAQSARWNRQSDQFNFLVNELYPDTLRQDADYWPAHYEAGKLFLEKYNQADAAREFNAALEINPNAAEVHAALALVALEDRNVEKAEASLRRALEINPHLADAWLLRADLLWVTFHVAETLSLLEKKVLPLNPISEQTLGRIAACYLMLDGAKPQATGASRFDKLVAEVTKRNPHAGEFYFTLAGQFEARNKQTLSEPYFREAIRVMPRQVGPESHLGLLYMHAGREDEARRILRAAFRADPFNVRVKNSLDVLDVLEGMQSFDSPRFTIRCQAEDKLLAHYAAGYLAKTYPRLCQQFGYTPPERALVEIFNKAQGLSGHQWFSARMVGLPYLDTVAASTGRIVAMVSPSELGHRMGWARVLTHEMVHVITLQQTHFDCPRWFTEGLAVWSENAARPRVWCQSLARRVADDKLLNLETINGGFTRPQSSDDCLMAYCQSELYVEYMLGMQSSRPKKNAGGTSAPQGEVSLRQMLAAYADGLSTADAIRRVFGISQAPFEKGYRDFIKEQAAKFKTTRWASESELERLRKAAKNSPEDARTAAELAQAAKADADDLESRRILARCAQARKDFFAAEGWATEAVEIDVRDVEMHRILAYSLANRHNERAAVAEFEIVLELKPGDAEAKAAIDTLTRKK